MLRQFLQKIQGRQLTVETFVLEAWDQTCRNYGNQEVHFGATLQAFSQLGYTIYRTMINERSFDRDGVDYRLHFKDIAGKPPGTAEQWGQRLIKNIWRFDKRDLDGWKKLVEPNERTTWQYVLTTANLVEAGVRND